MKKIKIFLPILLAFVCFLVSSNVSAQTLNKKVTKKSVKAEKPTLDKEKLNIQFDKAKIQAAQKLTPQQRKAAQQKMAQRTKKSVATRQNLNLRAKMQKPVQHK